MLTIIATESLAKRKALMKVQPPLCGLPWLALWPIPQHALPSNLKMDCPTRGLRLKGHLPWQSEVPPLAEQSRDVYRQSQDEMVESVEQRTLLGLFTDPVDYSFINQEVTVSGTNRFQEDPKTVSFLGEKAPLWLVADSTGGIC